MDEGYAPTEERAAIGLWKWSMQHRWVLDLLPVKMKDWSLGQLLGQVGWSKRRESLHIGGPSFRELWKARSK